MPTTDILEYSIRSFTYAFWNAGCRSEAVLGYCNDAFSRVSQMNLQLKSRPSHQCIKMCVLGREFWVEQQMIGTKFIASRIPHEFMTKQEENIDLISTPRKSELPNILYQCSYAY